MESSITTVCNTETKIKRETTKAMAYTSETSQSRELSTFQGLEKKLLKLKPRKTQKVKQSDLKFLQV